MRYAPSVNSSATTENAASEDVDVLAPPEGVVVLEHGFYSTSAVILSRTTLGILTEQSWDIELGVLPNDPSMSQKEWKEGWSCTHVGAL
jgi:hypothetical protein